MCSQALVPSGAPRVIRTPGLRIRSCILGVSVAMVSIGYMGCHGHDFPRFAPQAHPEPDTVDT